MQLSDYINWLFEKDYHSLEIYNFENDKLIDKCIKADDFSGSQDIEEYFEEILNRGINKIIVQKMMKKGTANVRQGPAKPFSLSTKNQPTKDERVVERGGNALATAPAQPQFQQPAMNAPGLNAEQSYKIYNHDKILGELQTLQTENKRLESENKKLDREVLKYQLGVEGKPGAFEKLLESLSPETLATLAQIFIQPKSGGNTEAVNPALNAPDLSRFKIDLIDIISQKNVPDDAIKLAYQVIDRFMNKDEEFLEQYTKLAQQAYKKHKENASSN